MGHRTRPLPRRNSAGWIHAGRKGSGLLLILGLATTMCYAATTVRPAAGPQRQVALSQPACTAKTPVTPAETEGPYYRAGSPERKALVEKGTAGTPLTLTGYVLSRGDCTPVAHAWLDFWHANDKGVYDNSGYRLRGHQFADSAGRYSLRTIVPGVYPGRTRHIHVKVRGPNGPMLTTQIYFPGEPRNQSDGLFNPALLANVRGGDGADVATINFVVNVR
jgi:protocatechuate 3,4-dioxygenase beta subunit